MGIRIWYKIGTWNLKIFFPISLGIHLLFLSLTSILFPGFKINQLPNLNIEVSLLPLIPEVKMDEKIPLKDSNKKEPLRGHESQITNDKENRPSHHNPREEITPKKDMELESPPSSQMIATNISSEEPKLTVQDEKWEIENKNNEKVVNDPMVIPAVIPKAVSLPSEASIAFNKEENSLSLKLTSPRSEEPRNVVKLPASSDNRDAFVQPKYVENPKPFYPQEARKKGFQGEVVLRIEVLSNGLVGQVEIKKSSGYDLLDRSALTTVKQWRFIPAKKGEEVIPLWVNIPIKFQLR